MEEPWWVISHVPFLYVPFLFCWAWRVGSKGCMWAVTASVRAVTASVWAFTAYMGAVICAIFATTASMWGVQQLSCYSLCVVCYWRYCCFCRRWVDCIGAMSAVTTFIWTVTVSIWAVQALCSLLQVIWSLLRALCGLYIRYMCCYNLYVGYYSLYVGCYNLYGGCYRRCMGCYSSYLGCYCRCVRCKTEKKTKMEKNSKSADSAPVKRKKWTTKWTTKCGGIRK